MIVKDEPRRTLRSSSRWEKIEIWKNVWCHIFILYAAAVLWSDLCDSGLTEYVFVEFEARLKTDIEILVTGESVTLFPVLLYI